MDARGIVGVGSAPAIAVAALTASAEPTPAVEIQLFQFKPGAVEVKSGTAITWTNGDDIEHTVTSGDPEHRTGRFDQHLSGRGSAATIKLSAGCLSLLLRSASVDARRGPRQPVRAVNRNTTRHDTPDAAYERSEP